MVCAQPETDPSSAQLLVLHPGDLTQIFGGLVQEQCPVAAHFDHGTQLMQTLILGLDPASRTLYLDISNNHRFSYEILRHADIHFSARVEQVEYQWSTHRIERGFYRNRPAFVTPYPGILFRAERRASFRVQLPATSPVECEMPLPSGRSVQARAVDLSLGGIGLEITEEACAHLTPGTRFANSVVRLERLGAIEMPLRIVSIEQRPRGNGPRQPLAHCAFTHRRSYEAVIQRYLLDMQRRQLRRRATAH